MWVLPHKFQEGQGSKWHGRTQVLCVPIYLSMSTIFIRTYAYKKTFFLKVESMPNLVSFNLLINNIYPWMHEKYNQLILLIKRWFQGKYHFSGISKFIIYLYYFDKLFFYSNFNKTQHRRKFWTFRISWSQETEKI